MNLKAIAGDPDNVAGNLLSYLHAFSSDVADIFERFEMPAQIDRLQKADLLYLVNEKFASIGWSQFSTRYSTTPTSDIDEGDQRPHRFFDRPGNSFFFLEKRAYSLE